MNNTQQLLWTNIKNFQLDLPKVGFSFATRLARENNWTLEYAEIVIKEYKRFIYLKSIATHPVTPSESVKRAWQLHLLYTRSYWEGLCERIIGKALHHSLIREEVEGSKTFKDSYEFTLEMYRVSFKENAPNDIWPSVEKRVQEHELKRRNIPTSSLSGSYSEAA